MAACECGRGSAGSILIGLEWQGCCYLSGGWTEVGNGEEYSPMGGDSGWMGTGRNGPRVEAGYRDRHLLILMCLKKSQTNVSINGLIF